MNYSTDTEDTTAVLQKFTPKSLHGHIAEFVVGTPDDKDCCTDYPIRTTF